MVADGYTLREKKHARTKIAIMTAFMERLKHKRFDDISIKEVCREAEVAEGTFFNYFPEKLDLIGYFLYLTHSKMIWKAKKDAPLGKYLPLIDSMFGQMSDELKNNNLIYQIISVLLVQSQLPRKMSVSGLELSLFFPDCPGIEKISVATLYDWFEECVTGAVKNGELPSKVNVDDVVVSLMTIMTGTLLATRFCKGNTRGYHYVRQLNDLWKVLGVKNHSKSAA